MEREIKFKAKTIDTNKWVYGYLFKSWEKAFILWGTTNNVPNMIEVIPETVGQSTGLKDKNDNLIYEGDIIEYTQVLFNTDSEKFPTKRKEVKYYTGIAKFNIYETNAGEYDIEVIGNIYENENLLTKNK